MKISLKPIRMPFLFLLTLVSGLSAGYAQSIDCARTPNARGCLGEALQIQEVLTDEDSLASSMKTRGVNPVPVPNIHRPYGSSQSEGNAVTSLSSPSPLSVSPAFPTEETPQFSESESMPVPVNVSPQVSSESLARAAGTMPAMAPVVVTAPSVSSPASEPVPVEPIRFPTIVGLAPVATPVMTSFGVPSSNPEPLPAKSAVRFVDFPAPVIDENSPIGLPAVKPVETEGVQVLNTVFSGRKGEEKSEEKSIQAYAPDEVNYGPVKSNPPQKSLKSGLRKTSRFDPNPEGRLSGEKKSLRFNTEVVEPTALDRFNQAVNKTMKDQKISQEAAQRAVIAKIMRMQSTILRPYFPDTETYPKVGQSEFMTLTSEQQKEYRARMTRSLELAMAELQATGEIPQKEALFHRVLAEEGKAPSGLSIATSSETMGGGEVSVASPTQPSADTLLPSGTGAMVPQLMGSSLSNPVTNNPDTAERLLSSVDSENPTHEAHVLDEEGKEDEGEDEDKPDNHK